jgi:hypothetical protein
MRWVPVYGYEGFYEVSTAGKIRRILKSGRYRILKLRNANNYLAAHLCKNNSPKSIKVHRIVLESFGGPFKEGQQSNHKNGDKKDNRLCNLERCSMSQNICHRMKTLGINHKFSAKLNKNEVLKIRKLHTLGFNGCELARMFRVTSTCIYYAIHKKSWKDI